MTNQKKHWQLFVTFAVIFLVAFDFYLLFTNRFPFAQTEAWQLETLGAVYAAGIIVTFIALLFVQLIPLFLLKWIIEKATGDKLT